MVHIECFPVLFTVVFNPNRDLALNVTQHFQNLVQHVKGEFGTGNDSSWVCKCNIKDLFS